MILCLRKTHVLVVFVCLASILAACRSGDEDRGPITIAPDQLKMFADDFFARQMEELHIPGVTFVFVQDGTVLLAKGYGLANLEEGIPFDPEESVVRIGSVSKLFVATAVMQLVERGELDLYADVNQYLTTFQLDESYPEPATLAHLLTHTAGFEDPPYQTTTDPTEVQPLGSYLAEQMPPRVEAPGQVFRYCNQCYALAAYIVEQVSGISFDQYVEENILAPLGMERTGYLLSPLMPHGLAVGYFYENGGQIPQPIDYDHDYPGGSLVSTAEDMAKFMFAHLEDGCYQDTCILQSATIAEMHQGQFTMRPREMGATYGFTEGFLNGQRLIGHTGAIRGFGASLDLLPEHDMGYFFAFNEECYLTSACDIIPRFRREFAKRFFPSGPRIPLFGGLEGVRHLELSLEPTRAIQAPPWCCGHCNERGLRIKDLIWNRSGQHGPCRAQTSSSTR
jgi:CubicO group peptidase (beta-lactamase class C family)